MPSPTLSLQNVTVIQGHLEYLPAFRALNLEWIRTYFEVEPLDVIQLNLTEEMILAPGGEIFFVLVGDDVVGTCAMIPHGEHGFELAKMAVAPSAKGKGYGHLLMRTAIDWAREKNAQEITLLSNTILEAAITLFKKHGFVVTHTGQHLLYKRANIEMRLHLST